MDTGGFITCHTGGFITYHTVDLLVNATHYSLPGLCNAHCAASASSVCQYSASATDRLAAR